MDCTKLKSFYTVKVTITELRDKNGIKPFLAMHLTEVVYRI